MRFHPVASVILGVIAAIIFFGPLWNFSIFLFGETSWALWGLIFAALIIGGFIATYFTKEKRIRYGSYVGIILAAMMILWLGFEGIIMAIFQFMFYCVFFSVIAGIGGFIVKITDKSDKYSFKKRILNGFQPITSIITGIIVTLIFTALIITISPSSASFVIGGLINIAPEVISFVIGGFVTAFLVKKIQYGIYEGIYAEISLTLFLYLGSLAAGYSNAWNYYSLFATGVVYILFAGVGGCLGIIAVKHLKQTIAKAAA